MTASAHEIGLLRWRCRRGTRELDRLLGSFLEEEFEQLSGEQQQAFRALLDAQDPDIFDWLMGAKIASEPGVAEIVSQIRRKFGLD